MKIRMKSILIINIIMIMMSCQTTKYLKLNSMKWVIEYSEKDEKQAQEISKLLEKKYYEVRSILNPDFNENISIKIYPDLQSFNDARSVFGFPPGKPNGGNAIGTRQIMLVASNIYDTAIHEYTHLVIASFAQSPKGNLWINESICYFLGEQKYGSLSYLKSNYKNNNYFNEFSQNQYYIRALYYMGQYLFDNYTYEQIKKLITTQSVATALGITKEEYWDSWCVWVERRKF